MKTFETEKGIVWYDAYHHCDYHGLNDGVTIEFEHEDSNFIEKIKVGEAKLITQHPIRHAKRWRLIPQTKEVEWVNGDKCIYNDEEFTFVSYMCKPEEDHVVIWRSFSGIEVVYKTQISKPETEAERKEREELEAASYLLSDWFNAIGKDMPEWSSVNEDVKAHYLRIVRKTNYKVKGE